MTARRYRVLVGLNYPPNGKGAEVRAEPEAVVDDLPPRSLPWLLEQNIVEPVKAGDDK